MALLTKQVIQKTGLAPTYAACGAGGDEVAPGDDTFVHVKNASGGALVVTIVTPKTVQGVAVADVAVSVPAAGERLIGPLGRSLFGNPDAADPEVDITYSGVTSLTIAALQLSQ